MSTRGLKHKDYSSLSAKPLKAQGGGTVPEDLPPLRSSGVRAEDAATLPDASLINPNFVPREPRRDVTHSSADVVVSTSQPEPGPVAKPKPGTREAKRFEREEKDRKLLSSERWLARNGHTMTFVGLYLFSVMVLYRPYELIPALGFLASTAFYFALATLAFYLPTQIATEGNITILPTDVKALLAMTFIALVTIPIAKSPATAWETFNEPFIKAVIMFIVLVNVIRTRKRLMAMMWVSISVGIYLGYESVSMYMQGKFNVDTYRVGVEVGGLFGNPNDMALHFVMMTPLVVCLGVAAKSKLWRIIYFSAALLFILGNMVTFSRGGFIGLIAVAAVLAFKLGRKYRLNVTIGTIVVTAIGMIAAPGNYGLRMLSIFIPTGMDNGSGDQRRELLERSLLVTARNPWGIGIGNFPIVGIHDHQTHNAFTQVSSEIGILGLVAYMIFIISPYRKLSAIERTLFRSEEHSWFYYLAIGLQVSIVGYLVTSFFASVAYNWFIYYLIAYAVAFRRIYRLETDAEEERAATELVPQTT